jgi:hypothetical protein
MALEDPSQLDLLKIKKKPKYRNKKCVVDGIQFDSEKEARRWPLLQEMERQGKIRNLRRQVPFKLEVNDILICLYLADYVYLQDGQQVIEDVKSEATRKIRLYVVKKKLMLAIKGIAIKEV